LRELREIRLRRGLSQADLSAKTGVAEFTISEIETGKRPHPRPSTLRKLAEALGVEVADLYGDSEIPLGEAPPSPEQPSLNGLLEEERREAIYRPWLDFINRYADRWEARLEAGAFDLGSLEEFDRVTDDLLETLGPLGLQEKREQPPDYHYSYGPIIGEAIGRIFDLLTPMLAAAAHKFPREVLGDDLEPLRRKRDEGRRRELRRGA
jgi:transcriptional regulator with XRE-family HTH domain